MADIKNIITGTIGNIVGKVKEVAESGVVQDTVMGIYEQGSTRVKSYGQMAKLSLELTGDKEELKKLYTEIGRLYFEETQEPDSFFAPLFQQAQELCQRIETKEAIIADLKASEEECVCEGEECACDENIEVEICEFEEVVEATEADGCCAEPAAECCCETEAPAEEVSE